MKDQMAKTQKRSQPGYIGAAKFWAWQSRAMSAAAQFIVVSGFVALYSTSMLGLSAAKVGMLLAVSKIIDAITDLFAGYLVDRTETRIGKARPYEISILGLWLTTWLIFSVPAGASETLKYIWVIVFYIFNQAVFSTLLSANQNAYMIRSFANDEQRVKLASFGGVVIMLGAVAVNIMFPMMIKQLATNLQGWSQVVGMFALIFSIIGIMRFVVIKEKNRVDISTSDNIRFKDVVAVMKHNKYVYMIAFMWLIYSLGTGMGVGTYYFTYIVGDISKMGLMNSISILVLPVLMFFPAVMKRVSKGKLVMLGSLAMIVNGILMFFAEANLLVIGIAVIFIGLGTLPITYLTDLLMIDCATYNEYKNGFRMDGVISAIKGFAGKVGSAFGSAVLGILLSFGGFISTTNGEAVTQPETAMLMIRIATGILPAVLYVVVAIMMHYYRLDSEIPAMKQEIDKRIAETAKV